MKTHSDGARPAQIHAIAATGSSLAEAVRTGLDLACEAVDRIAESARSQTGTARTHVIDIVLKCPGDDILRAGATAFWAQAQPNLRDFFPMNSLVFWAAVAGLPAPEPGVVQTIHAFFARIAKLNAEMEHSQIRCSDAYLLGEFEAMMLAAANRQYLPCYTSLLRHWDMDHETREQFDTITELALAHGPCPEVDDLIATRLIEAPGQHGFEQFQELHPKFVDWYGDPLASPVFRLARQKMQQRGVTNHSALQEIFVTDWRAQ